MKSKRAPDPSKMLEVVYKPIGDLIPYAKNSRTHSEEQIAAIAASLRKFGWTNPVLVDGNGIIAGHGRVLAAPLVWDAGGEIKRTTAGLVPTTDLSDLTEDEKRAYVIADNQLALRAGWDETVLRSEIADLKALDFDLTQLGFNTFDLSALLVPKADGDTDPSVEWTGMPEFNQGDLMPDNQLIVSFRSIEDREAFAELVGQNVTAKTKSIWYPEAVRNHTANIEYGEDE